MDRRKFISASGAGLTGLILPTRSGAATRLSTGKSPDVIVVGAGVFGLWTTYKLLGKGLSVLLFDAYGPGNTIGSSGGHTRAIQADADVSTYVRSVLECYPQWQELERTSYARLLYGSNARPACWRFSGARVAPPRSHRPRHRSHRNQKRLRPHGGKRTENAPRHPKPPRPQPDPDPRHFFGRARRARRVSGTS